MLFAPIFLPCTHSSQFPTIGYNVLKRTKEHKLTGCVWITPPYIKYLESKSYGDPHNEEEEGHHEIGQCASVPR